MLSGFIQTPLQFLILEVDALTPRRDRETFSGGWNDSAIARNAERLKRSGYVVDRRENRIYCARGMAKVLAASIRGAEARHG